VFTARYGLIAYIKNNTYVSSSKSLTQEWGRMLHMPVTPASSLQMHHMYRAMAWLHCVITYMVQEQLLDKATGVGEGIAQGGILGWGRVGLCCALPLNNGISWTIKWKGKALPCILLLCASSKQAKRCVSLRDPSRLASCIPVPWVMTLIRTYMIFP
jgi:hypothetical protein